MARSAGGGGGSTSCSIFVGNVPYDAQEDELRELFSKVGNVTSIRVVCDRDTRQQKGYAFCDFSDSQSVQLAIDKLNNVEYNGRKLRIDLAERELHASGAGKGGDRDRDGPGPAPPPRRGGAMPPIDVNMLPVPVPTVADRMAQLRDQQAAEQARVQAAETAERAEIGRLMETLMPHQIIHIVCEMQRLAIRAPEVARALLMENQQLALALQHAEFLAGMTEDPPVPTEPEVRERAISVREKLWGSPVAPAPPHPSAIRAAQSQLALQQGVQQALPVMLGASAAAALPFGATVQVGACVAPTLGFMQAPAAPAPVPPAGSTLITTPVQLAVPGPMVAQSAAPPIPPAVLSQVLGGAVTDEGQGLMDQLLRLSPAEIDVLPHHTKVQLLDYLQKLPARS